MKRQHRLTAGALLLAIVGAGPAYAASTADLQHCRGIADDGARLNCYDALVPAAAAPPAAPAPAAAAAPAVAPIPAANSAAGTADDFGAETVKRGREDKPQEQALQARVVGHIEIARKGARYKLDNGQLWLNIDDREVLVDLDNPAVTIERNFIGSYFMKAEGKSWRIRVRRIQ